METKLYAYPSDVRTTDQNVLKVLRESGIPINEAAWIASGSPGMELRDYFAGQALAGNCGFPTVGAGVTASELAEEAYNIADAMLLARMKESK